MGQAQLVIHKISGLRLHYSFYSMIGEPVGSINDNLYLAISYFFFGIGFPMINPPLTSVVPGGGGVGREGAGAPTSMPFLIMISAGILSLIITSKMYKSMYK